MTDVKGTGEPLTPTELTRAIRLPHATAIVVGIIVGSAIFRQPSVVTSHVPTVAGVFLVWFVSGVLTLLGALVCAELASMFPQSGGVYVYLRESFGRPLAFLWGWAMFWTMHSGIIAAIAFVFAQYAQVLLPIDDRDVRAIAVAAILILSAVNLLGVSHGSTLQLFFTGGKLVAIAVIIAIGFAFGGAPDTAMRGSATTVVDGAVMTFQSFALALVAGLFAYGGWHMVTYSAGETIDPQKTIPRALAIGVTVVTACYITLNAVYLYVLPLETVASSKRIAADAANAVLGSGGEKIMAALVTFSAFGALAGVILTGPRVYYAMAHDGVTFGWLGEVHPTRRTPNRAIILQGAWSVNLVVTGTYGAVYERVIYTEWIFFGMMALGLIRLRSRNKVTRRHVVWGYPIAPVAFAVAAFGIAANQIYSKPIESAIGLSIVVAGLPVYYVWTALTGKRKRIA
jgi:amino acid transporter